MTTGLVKSSGKNTKAISGFQICLSPEPKILNENLIV